MDFQQSLPADRSRIGNVPFAFHCHPGVACFLSCCRNVNLLLFPYDIILLKNHLQMHSADFLAAHTELCAGSHPLFPGLQLKLLDDAARSCPFLGEQGCTVYRSRPSACRTYPLERGVERPEDGQPLRVHYFMTHHPYCLGHQEQRTCTLTQWEREQQLHECNHFNDLWAELDAFFATNPWAGEGVAGPYQQLAFMVCYNIDGFRDYVRQHNLPVQFVLNKSERQRLMRDDSALLQFGFKWLEMVLGGRRQLVKK